MIWRLGENLIGGERRGVMRGVYYTILQHHLNFLEVQFEHFYTKKQLIGGENANRSVLKENFHFGTM